MKNHRVSLLPVFWCYCLVAMAVMPKHSDTETKDGESVSAGHKELPCQTCSGGKTLIQRRADCRCQSDIQPLLSNEMVHDSNSQGISSYNPPEKNTQLPDGQVTEGPSDTEMMLISDRAEGAEENRVTEEDICQSIISDYSVGVAIKTKEDLTALGGILELLPYSENTLNDYFVENFLLMPEEKLSVQIKLQALRFYKSRRFVLSDFNHEFIWNITSNQQSHKILSYFFYTGEGFRGAALLERAEGTETCSLSIVLVIEDVIKRIEKGCGHQFIDHAYDSAGYRNKDQVPKRQSDGHYRVSVFRPTMAGGEEQVTGAVINFQRPAEEGNKSDWGRTIELD